MFPSVVLSEEDQAALGKLKVPVPTRELERLELLRETKLLDSKVNEKEYEELIKSAASTFSTPMAIVSLLDVSRQWFKARIGLESSETHRDEAFCSYTILEQTEDVMLVLDATQDDRFRENSLVCGVEHIRFYAGAALRLRGIKVGTLCVIDKKPRTASEFGEKEKRELLRLAAKASALIDARHRAEIEVVVREAHQAVHRGSHEKPLVQTAARVSGESEREATVVQSLTARSAESECVSTTHLPHTSSGCASPFPHTTTDPTHTHKKPVYTALQHKATLIATPHSSESLVALRVALGLSLLSGQPAMMRCTPHTLLVPRLQPLVAQAAPNVSPAAWIDPLQAWQRSLPCPPREKDALNKNTEQSNSSTELFSFPDVCALVLYELITGDGQEGFRSLSVSLSISASHDAIGFFVMTFVWDCAQCVCGVCGNNNINNNNSHGVVRGECVFCATHVASLRHVVQWVGGALSLSTQEPRDGSGALSHTIVVRIPCRTVSGLSLWSKQGSPDNPCEEYSPTQSKKPQSRYKVAGSESHEHGAACVPMSMLSRIVSFFHRKPAVYPC